MDIRKLKTEASELAAIAKEGDATQEQLTRMNEISTIVENYNNQAEAAARSISMVDTHFVDTNYDSDVEETRSYSLGESFVRSVPTGNRNRSPKIEGAFSARAITTSTIVTNPTLVPVAAPAPRSPLASLVNIERVNTTSVDYVVENIVNNSDVVAEGNLKPETTITFTPNSVVLDVIAHYVDVSRQALEDETRLQGIIDNALRNGLVRKTENKLATTIINDANIIEVEGSTLLNAIRFGMAQVEVSDYTPNTVMINPFDLAELDIGVAGSFREVSKNATLWGMNVVTSSEIPVGTAYVGDIFSAVTWFDRGVAAVYTTDADADKFRRNIITILAETRAKAAIVRPAALAKAVFVSTVLVPNVVGMSQEEATTTMEVEGLVVSIGYSTSGSSETWGTVIFTDPAAETEVASGSTVTVVVSVETLP